MAQAGDAAAGGGGWEDKIWTIGKQVAMFVGVQYAIKSFMGSGGQQQKQDAPQKVEEVVSESEWSAFPNNISPFWSTNQTVDVQMYVAPSIRLPPLSAIDRQYLVLDEKNFSLDFAAGDKREISTSFSVPNSVQDNGTLWAHIFIAHHGAQLDPSQPGYDTDKAYRILRPLTNYLAKKKVRKTKNLLASSDETDGSDQPTEETGPTLASYYHPNFTLAFIPDSGTVNYPRLHPAVKQFYYLEPNDKRDASGKDGFYYPLLYHNTFWQLRSQMIELNTTVPQKQLDLNVDLKTLNNWKFSLMASVDEGGKETARKVARGESAPGGGDGTEIEMIKEVLLDSNIYLLGTTVVVSVLHMIFELLAFKSDVGHWRNKKDNVGVSVRTILANVFMQSVIFLYLLDNNENTSWMILFGQGVGIAIEAWKITKTVDVRIRDPAPESWPAKLGLPKTIVFEDKHKLSETEEKTEEYDRIAFYYMGIIAVPLLLAYAGYSIVYEEHKSWYSFIIATLVGSVYAYGFLMMIPSLYINYRLKSVAHMPAKAMTYKFLNTFIDDLFAFTIKMPLLHRLATLRDDVIFFVYIYQAWAYKVDYSRVNEFGQGGGDEELEEKKANKPLTSVGEADVSVGEGLKVAENGGEVNVNSGRSENGKARKRRG